MIKLAIIFGGPSGEHGVSLKSTRKVVEALDKTRYEIFLVAITKEGRWLFGDLAQSYLQNGIIPQLAEMSGVLFDGGALLKEKIDLAFVVGHGTFMEDGRIQAVLETLQIPYLFSGVLASALAMNKEKSKIIAKNSGLKVAKNLIIKKGDKINFVKMQNKLGLPIVVKPNELGSSVGMAIAKSEDEFKTGVLGAMKWCDEVLLEQFIGGRELTVAVMGRKKLRVLPVVEIIPKSSSWFDYEAKYAVGGSEEICPAQIPDDIAKKAQRYAKKIFQAIGCRDLARVDFIWDEKANKIYFLEINTIPGMTETSLAPQAAQVLGLDFGRFLDELIMVALKK